MSVKCKVDKNTEVDIDKAVHILVGGSTGSGKSYLMKNMLCDMLLCDEYVNVIVIDPKSVDYQFLENSRDLGSIGRADETVDIKMSWRERGIKLMDRDSIDNLDVIRYLKSLVKEMYARYRFMKFRGYVDWNEVLENGEEYSSMFGGYKIIVLVDELADLIYWDRQKNMEILLGYSDEDDIHFGEGREDGGRGIELGLETTGRETEGLETQLNLEGGRLDEELGEAKWRVLDSDEWKMLKGSIEGSLIKLSILGRAAGIHLVLGTQRPDASILSGQLRANLPTRICLRVSNDMERRIILGQSIKSRDCERFLMYQSQLKELVRDLK